MKPERVFSANEGEYSTGLAGPDAIEQDIDTLCIMFDPLNTHQDGEQGGIGEENIRDDAITDSKIGNREIIPNSVTRSNFSRIGTLTFLLNMLAELIKEIKGTEYFDDEVLTNLKNAYENINELFEIKADKTYVDSEDTNLQNQIDTNSDEIQRIDDELETHIEVGHGDLYYTKEELKPFLSGADTRPQEEVFTIINPDNGDGTFTYEYESNLYTGQLTDDGYPIFKLRKGYYNVGKNMIELYINDTLRRSSASGGIIEIDETSIALTEKLPAGAEITVYYFTYVGIAGEKNIIISETKPPKSFDKSRIWFKVSNDE